MKPAIVCLMIAVLTAGPAASALAADLPSPPLKIVAVEMIDGENVLRLMVRRRIEVDEPPLDFNTSGCTLLTTIDQIDRGQATVFGDVS